MLVVLSRTATTPIWRCISIRRRYSRPPVDWVDSEAVAAEPRAVEAAEYWPRPRVVRLAVEQNPSRTFRKDVHGIRTYCNLPREPLVLVVEEQLEVAVVVAGNRPGPQLRRLRRV